MEILFYDISTQEFSKVKKEELELTNEYKNLKNRKESFFSTESFHILHMKNAEEVFRIFIKNKASIIAEFYIGKKNEKLLLPYSSPFFYINEFKTLRDEEYLKISNSIKEICLKIDVKEIQIIFSPRIYNGNIENIEVIFLNNGFKIKYCDLNHYFDLSKDILMDRSIKKDITIAKKNELKFEISNLNDAYEIVKTNRQERGFPLRMSKDHLENIVKLENSEVETFIVRDKNNQGLAAAIVFKIQEKKYQVVYWGNVKDGSEKKPMSFLVQNLLDYYKQKADILDIGPSSESGIINFGLSQFKRNIGCLTCNKIVLEYKSV